MKADKFPQVATLAAVLAHFVPAAPPGGGGDDPPTTTAKPSSTSSSSTTCSPTMSPTAMVILMTEDATDAQYKDLALSIPNAENHVEIIYEVVNFRVLIADVDDCDIKKLWENPIVETMSLEGPLILDDEADDDVSTTTKREAFKVPQHEFEHATRNASKATAGLKGRLLDPLVNLKTQTNSPWHLKLLSGLSHQVGNGLNGLFYDFKGYLYADRASETNDGVSDVNIYVLDTGLRVSHNVSQLLFLLKHRSLIDPFRSSLADK